MDLATEAPTGFQAIFDQFVAYAGPIIQLLYWLAIAFAAIYAAIQFKRLVDARIAALAAIAADSAAEVDDTADDKIDIDAFVE